MHPHRDYSPHRQRSRHASMNIHPRPSILRIIGSRRMLVAFVMGFSSGLPLLLTISVLQAWMKKERGRPDHHRDDVPSWGCPTPSSSCGPPVFDRFTLPFLGRRRGWLLVSQIALMAAVASMGHTDPVRTPWVTAFTAFLVTFFSASQDIVVDAYRREDLSDEELGLGSSLYIYGYRLGMLLASGGGLIMADHIPFSSVYLLMALCLLPGVVTTLTTPEPAHPEGAPATLARAVVDPLVEYFRRDGAVWILAFILLYKVGDTMASTMTTPFYLDVGFSMSQIGAVVKLFGFLGHPRRDLPGGGTDAAPRHQPITLGIRCAAGLVHRMLRDTRALPGPACPCCPG